MSLDLKLSRALLRCKDLEPVLPLGLTRKLLSPDGAVVFDCIADFFGKYGRMPKMLTIKRETGTDLRNLAAAEPVRFYRDKLVERTRRSRLVQAIEEASALIAKDVDGAIEKLKPAIWDREFARSKPLHYYPEALDRLREYQRIKSLDGKLTGVKTPWPVLDEQTQGWQKGWFVSLVAVTNTGKTFTMILFGAAAVEAGRRVLFVSTEMSTEEIAVRWDAAVTHTAPRQIHRGGLGEFEEEAYRKALRRMAKGRVPQGFPTDPVMIVDGALVRTLDDIEALIEQAKPDLVLVDGMYNLKLIGARSKYDTVAGVVEGLKGLAVGRALPLIGSTQFHRAVGGGAGRKRKDGEEGGGPTGGATKGTMQNVAFAYETSMLSDVMIAQSQDAHLVQERQMEFAILKLRREEKIHFRTQWDIDRMMFDVIATAKDTDAGFTGGGDSGADEKKPSDTTDLFDY